MFEWILIFFGGLCGYFYNEIKDLKQRTERLESKVYDLEENTVKNKKDYDL